MASIVDGWRPELHPRDQHGRFRNKWKLNSVAARLIDGIVGAFDPKLFASDHDARDYMRQIGGHDYGKEVNADVSHYIDGGWQQINAEMRKGQDALPQGMRDSFKPSEADLILSRAVSPAAFGLPAGSDPEAIKEWTGRLVSDKAPSATSIGTPLQQGPGTINMAILAPKGTNMIVPGNGSPDAILEPGQPIRITKVTGDAQNGIHVWAVLQPHNEKTRTRALGRKLTTAEIGPTDSTDVNLPEAQRVAAQRPPSMEERIKALEAKMAARASAPKEAAPGAPVQAAEKAAPAKVSLRKVMNDQGVTRPEHIPANRALDQAATDLMNGRSPEEVAKDLRVHARDINAKESFKAEAAQNALLKVADGLAKEKPSAPKPATEAKKVVKRAPRKPKEPQIADSPPPGEAPSQLEESTPEAAAAVSGLRANMVSKNPTPEDAVRLRKKLDGENVATVREAAKVLNVPGAKARKKDAIVDAIVKHIYGRKTEVPAREPKPVKKVAKAAEAAVPEAKPAEGGGSATANASRMVDKLKAATPENYDSLRKELEGLSHDDLLQVAHQSGIQQGLTSWNRMPRDHIENRMMNSVVPHEVVNAVAKRHRLAREAKAAEAAPAVEKAVKPQREPGSPAIGKTNIGRLQPGDKILVEKSVSKEGDRFGGPGGRWIPATKKTGATVLTVTGKSQAAYRRTVVHGKDENGNEITTASFPGHQTFFVAKEKVKLEPVKAAEKVANAPEAGTLESELRTRGLSDLMSIASTVKVDTERARVRREIGYQGVQNSGPRPKTGRELASDIAAAVKNNPELEQKVRDGLAKAPALKARKSPVSRSEAHVLTDAVPARRGRGASLSWAEGHDPGWDEKRAKRAGAALLAYRKHSFEINSKARGHEIQDKIFPDELTAQHLAGLDDVMSASKTQEPLDVWRGMYAREKVFGTDGDLTGKEWTDAAFVSTSLNQDASRTYATNGKGGVLMRIHVPKGVGAAEVQNGQSFQREVLLQRGLRMRVTKDHGEQPGWGYRLVDVEVLPSGHEPSAVQDVAKTTEKIAPKTGAEARAARSAKIRARTDAYGEAVRKNPALMDQGPQGEARAQARRDAITEVRNTLTQLEKSGASNTEIADAIDKVGAKHADLVHPEEAGLIESKIGDIADSFRDNKPAIGKRKIALMEKDEMPRSTQGHFGPARAAAPAASKPEPVKAAEPAKPELTPAEQRAADLTERMNRLRATGATQAPKAPAELAPAAPADAGTEFKSAYKAATAAGDLPTPSVGKQRGDSNKAYLLAARGHFDQAATGLRDAIAHDETTLAEMHSSKNPQAPKLEADIAANRKLLAFIEKRGKGAAAPAAEKKPAGLTVDAEAHPHFGHAVRNSDGKLQGFIQNADGKFQAVTPSGTKVGEPHTSRDAALGELGNRAATESKGITYASLKRNANGTVEPPPADQYINPDTFFPNGTKIHDPGGHFKRVERAAGVADVASRLLEVGHNHQPSDKSSFGKAIADQLQHWDNAPFDRESVAKWNANIDFRKENIKTPAELDAAVAKLAKEHGLTQVGKTDQVVPLDHKLHESTDRGLKAGDPVLVSRPGFTRAAEKGTPGVDAGTPVVLKKAVVYKATPEEAAAARGLSPAEEAFKKANIEIPAGKEGDTLRKAVENATTPELAKEEAARLRKHADTTRQLGGMRIANNPKGSFHHTKGQQDLKDATLYDHAADALDKVGAPESKPAAKTAVAKAEQAVKKEIGTAGVATKGKLPEGVVPAEQILAKQSPEDLRNAAEKVGIHVPDELRTSDQIAKHVIQEMGRKEAESRKVANRTEVGKMLANPKISDRSVLQAVDELSPAAHAKLNGEDRATLTKRLGSIANNTSNPRDVREHARTALDHLANKESTQPTKAVTAVPSATKQQFMEDEAKKAAAALGKANSGDEARGLLANKSREELVAIAKEAGVVHTAGATKPTIRNAIVTHTVQRRLNSQSIARLATPAHNPKVPDVRPEHHAVTAPRTNMLGELTHQLKEAGSDEARHALLANKTSATLHALGKEHGVEFNSEAGKLHMAKAIIEKITGKPSIGIGTRAPSGVDLQPRHDAAVHGDSALGSLWEDIKRNDPSGESNALLNRINEIGRDLSKLSNHDDPSAPQAAIDDLKKLRPQDFGTGPLERNRKLIDDTIARLDAPSVTVPDTSELGATVPHFVHSYLEELAKIPAARKAGIRGFGSATKTSIFDQKVALIKELDAGDNNAQRMRRAIDHLAQRDLHESVEGAYQIWALNRKYFDNGPGPRSWLKAIDERVKREADAAVNKAVSVPKGSGASRPYLDEYNHLDLKKLGDELGGDLQRFMDPTRNPMPLTNAPLAEQFPFGYSLQKIVDDAAGGHVSHNATIKELKDLIPTVERSTERARQELNRKNKIPELEKYRNPELAAVDQGPPLLDLLHKMIARLESEKLPARKTRPTLPPTVAGQIAPVDEAKFAQRDVRESLFHAGKAIPADFSHASREIPGVSRRLTAQIAAKAALPTNPLRPGLTTEESHALDVWTAGAPMRALQGSLRSGKVVHGSINPEDARHIGEVNVDDLQKHLDSAIQKGELKHDTVLWRGVLVKNADAKRFVPGAVFSDPGYTATAADRKAADDIINLWSRDNKFKGQKPAYFKILAPKGTHGALGHMGLSEVLLGRNQRFQVIRKEEGAPGEPPTYVVQALLPDHAQGKNLVEDFNYSGVKDKIVNFNTFPGGRKAPAGDPSLGKILKDQGFDAKPKVVSAQELDRAIKEDGAVELHRAVSGFEDRSSADLAEQFRTGELHPGTGFYGAGTYATPESGFTTNFGDEGGQLRMALPPSARTIKYPDLQKLHEKEMSDIASAQNEVRRKLAELAPGPSADRVRLMREQEQLTARKDVNHDLGRFAALLGYDAVVVPQGNKKGPKAPGAGEYVILNRSAVLVQKAHAAESNGYAQRQQKLAKLITEGKPEGTPHNLGGGSSHVFLVNYGGTKVVHKDQTRMLDNEAKKYTDAEELGNLILDAAGAEAPATHRDGPNALYMEHVPGTNGMEITGGATPGKDILDSRDGRLIGLADALMLNSDRNPGNWIQRPDKRIVGIDTGFAFQFKSPTAAYANPFAKHFVSGTLNNSDDPNSGISWAKSNDMHPEDMAVIRQRLEGLRPRFEAAGRLAWWTQIMKRMDILTAAAKGTERRL